MRLALALVGLLALTAAAPRDWRDADDDLADVTGEIPRVR